MVSAARTVPSFEVTAPPDIMDIHSDSGLDFNDDDIDLELHSPSHIDDDVSLKDATTDAGLEVQAASVDQDDFMADNEDLIDVDIVTYSERELQPLEATNAEEDLIDYSDEEEEEPPIANAVDVALTESPNHDQPALATPASAVEVVEEAVVPHDASSEDLQETLVGQDTVEDSRQTWPADFELDSQVGNEDDRRVSPEQQDESRANEDTGRPAEQTQEQTQGQAESTAFVEAGPGRNDSRQNVHDHQVTLNYDGVELWLFKHHDHEGSGDYIIEDTSLTDKPISSVIDACRAALGAEVPDDIELGFRLDNFHNIELYQDHSSCAFITLEQLVRVYLQLHAQDGFSDPESFYMTLISRPRVYALINTLNDAAAKGIGHIGLNRDIAAGLTSFNSRFANGSTGYEDWEHENNEEQQEYDSHSSAEPDALDEHNEEAVEEEYKEDVGEGQGDEQGDEQGHEQDEEAPEQQGEDDGVAPEPRVQNATTAGLNDDTHDHERAADGQAAPDGEDPSSRTATGQQSPGNCEHKADPQEEDDFIDYSEDEGDAEDSHGAQVQTNGLFSPTSTVQGDKASYPHDKGNNDEFAANGEVANDFGGDAEGELAQYGAFDEGFDDQTFQGEYFASNNEGLGQEYDDTQLSPDFLSTAHDETTNPNDESLEQTVDQHIDLTTDVNDGDFDGLDTTGDAFAGANAFLDFELVGATAEASADEQLESFGDDHINFDHEDGAVDQTPVAASAAAEPVVTSSSEFLPMSPQGHKRSIDEVGNDGGEATDTSDAKRPRV